MVECLECGEPGENTHPEYPGDKLCHGCYLVYCEEQLEHWHNEISDHIREHPELGGEVTSMFWEPEPE